MSRRYALAIAIAFAASACDAPPPAGGAGDAEADEVTGDTGTDALLEGETKAADAPTDDAADAASEASTAPDAGPDLPPPDLDAAPVQAPPLGGDRPAAVTLPAHYDASRPWPLVLLLHGYGATGFLQDAYLGFSAQATSKQLIAVVPEGTAGPDGKQFWNASPACCDFYGTGVDDVAYLTSLIADSRAAYNVDPSRIAVFGHSNGGFMAYRLACDAPGLVSAITSLAGGDRKQPATCTSGPAVSVLQVHGTLDSTVPYLGNATMPAAEVSIAHWLTRNACAPGATELVALDWDDGVAGPEAAGQRWTGCADGAEVELRTMHGSGHIPPFTPSFMPDVLDWLLSHGRPTP